jgi:hypothetical protein
MKPAQEHLEQARRHVVDAERRVAEQRARITQLEREGHDSESAQRLLDVLEQSLSAMRAHLELEEQANAEP